MDDNLSHTQHELPESSTSHPSNPIPEEPSSIPEFEISPIASEKSPSTASHSPVFPDSRSDSDYPSTPGTDAQVAEAIKKLELEPTAAIDFTRPRHKRGASTTLIVEDEEDVRNITGEASSGVKLIEKVCCNGGCCNLEDLEVDPFISSAHVVPPENDAFRSLHLKLGNLSLDGQLTKVVDVPPPTVSFVPLDSAQASATTASASTIPPPFVTPHPPYEVFSARIHSARELTNPGAEKRTYHFDLDVTDYPDEGGNVDFVVGGAIGVCAPNPPEMVDELFYLLGVDVSVQDELVTLKTTEGRWPTIWGDEQSRELTTTRRELVTWCSDLQSVPPTKPLLRLLAEHATDENERKILMCLSSAQGQAAFCDLRTGRHITVNQLLNAFPSSKPPLEHLLSTLQQLMPRFYSLSNDPHDSHVEDGQVKCRLIEVAVSVHETLDWRGVMRTGVASGYLERLAKQVQNAGTTPEGLNVTVPIFRGLMANPLAREFVSDGPMLLIGAGVGISPFRGFVQRRLKHANCANKVWVLQGIRDSNLDELYNGEWGSDEEQVKTVVQSRSGQGKYVQEEVRNQADLVWFIINSLDGRVFVCGSSRGMGEGVESALVDVAREKGRLNQEQAEAFWLQKKDGGQYITETW
ncbi:MAG: hypothetical protein M1816_002713 [Peltula sp. TS41687]|nr:MAG: hypothetical protein M1816_002713 [Peltula sp. TS41687]